MSGFVLSLLLALNVQGVIGHDIDILWEKGYNHEDSAFYFGRGIGAGDLTGDGYKDIAVSFGYLDTLKEHSYVGGVLVFNGSPLDTLPDITIWTHEEVSYNPYILVMDINSDGVDDLLCGFGYDRVIGFFGPLEDGQEEDFWMVGWITDKRIPTCGLGNSLANAGDVNGDGYDDLILGAPYPGDYGIYGGAYIYYGGPDFDPGYVYPPDVILPGGFCHGEHGWWEAFGRSVGGGGDFNADGYDDVIVGAPDYGNQAIYTAGRIYIYFGGDPMDSVEDVTFRGEGIANWLGADVNLLNNPSCAYALFGAELWPEGEFASPGKAYVMFGSEDWDSLPDVEIIGRTDSSNITQGGVSSVGDAEGDGRDDFILGAPSEYRLVDGEWREGAAYFYRGGNVIDNKFDGWLEGEGLDEDPASSFAPAGDFDGDGRDEFLVSNHAAFPLKKVWLCKFTGAGVEGKEDIDRGLQLELSATVTQEAVRFYYEKPLIKEASLTIYDVSGALVRRYSGLKESSVKWDLRDELGRRIPSGVYVARLDMHGNTATRRVVVLH